jgi:L-aminopeptidase/D-esterase-like protein
MTNHGSLNSVNGLKVGHWTDPEAATGCTVVLCPDGAVASVDVRGGAPGTRETDLLRAGTLVQRVHAILLSGGSAYGLDAATGVMRWLEKHGHGFPVPTGVVPIVPAAILIDLSVGNPHSRPDADAGYAACDAAASGPIAEGCAGAGTGASVGKALGIERALKGGIGTAAEKTASGVTVGALIAVNSFGEVVDPEDGRVIAGPRGERAGSFESTLEALRTRPALSPFAAAPSNSTIGVVATDAVLSKDEAYRLAVMAQTGLTQAIRPAHTPVDGDTIFALATGTNPTATDMLQLGTLAARAVARAIVRAVTEATSLAGVPSATEWAESRDHR